MTSKTINRREFIRISGIAGAGLVIGAYLPGCTPAQPATSTPTAVPPTATPELPEAPFKPNLFIRIDPDDTITVVVHRVEMGQGVRTALPMIVADELEADWSRIRVEQGPADLAFGDQVTGGSVSIQGSYTMLRRAGATARELLIAAAAHIWGVDAGECVAEQGTVVHRPTDRKLRYGELAGTAASLPTEGIKAKMKDPSQFRIIGTRVGRVDNLDIVTGRARFGIDVTLPGMLFASIERCPVFRGELASYDAADALKVAGVRQVIEVPAGLAVIADNTWAAFKGRQALKVTWDEGEEAGLSSDGIRQQLEKSIGRSSDDAGGQKLEAVYELPYLAHASIEPMNCVADVRSDGCDVWAPTQDPVAAKTEAVSASGVSQDAVVVNIPLLGGGFGRRLNPNYVGEAVFISKQVGAPIKLVWSREDDIRHDFYHPFSLTVVSAEARTADDVTVFPKPSTNRSSAAIPFGAWRAVENVPRAFARECFMDELAAKLDEDPYALRQRLLTGRSKAVLDLAASKANWGSPLPEGQGRGMAYFSTWGVSDVVEVAEVTVDENGHVRVNRVVCAVDCGRVINPDMVEAQMEGGIVFALTATLKAGIDIANGRVVQSNFHDYPLLRLDEMPVIEVYIVPSEEEPTGIGEMSGPPLIPAVANAIFAATGKRIRHIPIRPEDLRAS